eukprot:TRINITY_DN76857_c0_g1_i1.p1 TRINITY_DN76857_c0_g1~~TRINITY_DN76857_c0_g1_i1.p1  ORF type:complete len:352 (-),score=66.64 TRINITY_DN76857_c0_g1_i1:246-1301(-)
MDAIHVVTLRSICATYFETRVIPLIAEIKDTQGQLREELNGLALRPKVNENAHHETVFPTLVQFEELSRRVDLKSNAEDVSMLVHRSLNEILERFEVDAKATVVDAPTTLPFTQLEKEVTELSTRLEHKANVCDVSSVAQLDHLKEVLEREAIDQHELFEALWKKVDAVVTFAEAMGRSFSEHIRNSTCKVEELEAELKKKANIRDVPTGAQISEVLELLKQQVDIGKSRLQLKTAVDSRNIRLCTRRLQPDVGTTAGDEPQRPVQRPARKKGFKVLLNNLPPDMLEGELMEIGSQYGRVMNLSLSRCEALSTGRSGMLMFSKRKEAEYCLAELDDRRIDMWHKCIQASME